ncbi:ABC transporter ATP-binding protein [Roseateles koreensis]|uniref:ABC transporter ATP-binding protein n=1 Tax=Roseateles koreensis TaxID=2987526 RepID=A0ABT5KUI0_9BURK|nr:ABC transporter ATP-binding protein [Roseateles koreensis]MDC8786603.1 ABC transporter ATP-binding protein [Roseateles koreensis]
MKLPMSICLHSSWVSKLSLLSVLRTVSTASLSALLLSQSPAQAANDASETPPPAEMGRFEGPSHWRLVGSPYTLHYHPSPEHRHVWALGAEKQWDDTQWLAGASYFSNSFGQPSAYAYVGKRYPGAFGYAPPNVFVQWSAGLLYGYVGKFKDKVPFNHGGFSPGLLATVGWQFSPKNGVALHALGDAGLMLQFSHELD